VARVPPLPALRRSARLIGDLRQAGAGAPPATRPNFVDTLGPVAVAVAVGVNAFLAALLFLPSRAEPALTYAGTISVNPEWDSPAYVAAGVLSMALVPGLAFARDRLHRPVVDGAIQLLVAAGAMGVALVAFLLGRKALISGSTVAPGWALAFLVAVGACVAAGVFGRRWDAPAPASPAPPEAPGRRRLSPVDAIFPAILLLAIFAPGASRLSGATYLRDAMLHWDYFAMGPATAYAQGVALGTDINTFYGLGWPTLFAALSPVYELSYTHMIAVNVVVSCVYLVGTYAFLRLLLRSTAWACCGTTLVLVLHFFARSAGSFWPYWGFPSLGVLRWVFDIWLFMALLQFQRTGRRAWAVVAGAVLGMAVVFQTDTGLLLGVGWVFFWGTSALMAGKGRRPLPAFLASAGTAAGVFVAGALVASRGTFLQPDFWRGWLANLRDTSVGFSFEPITTGVGRLVVIAFLGIAVTHLLVAGCVLAQSIGRRASPPDLIVGALAIYGFLVLLYFTGRSTQYNLVRATIPFALLLAILGAKAAGAVLGGRTGARAVAGWAATVVAIAFLVTNPFFREYERHIALAGRLAGTWEEPEGDVCLLTDPRDLCGLSAALGPNQVNVARIAERLRTLQPPGGSTAVLDMTGPMFHLAAGTRAWGHWSPYFLTIARQDQVDEVVTDLRREPPDVVLFRAGAQPLFQDIVDSLKRVIVEGFVLDATIGDWEIWRRRA
jgi:hypothetical protein